MLKGADALAGIRFEHDSGEASLIAALSALEAIGAGEQQDTIISASGALSLFRETEGLKWVDTKEKSRHLLRRLGLRSATYRRERFWGRGQQASPTWQKNRQGLRDKASHAARPLSRGMPTSETVTAVTPQRAERLQAVSHRSR